MGRRERTEKVVSFLIVYVGVFALPWLSGYIAGLAIISGVTLFMLSGFASDP